MLITELRDVIFAWRAKDVKEDRSAPARFSYHMLLVASQKIRVTLSDRGDTDVRLELRGTLETHAHLLVNVAMHGHDASLSDLYQDEHHSITVLEESELDPLHDWNLFALVLPSYYHARIPSILPSLART